MAWLPLHSFKLFIPGKLTPVSAKLQTHTLSSPLSLSPSLTLKHTQTHTLFSLNSNINFSFLRSCGAFKPSDVINRSNFQAKDTSSFAEKELFFFFLSKQDCSNSQERGWHTDPATLKVKIKKRHTQRLYTAALLRTLVQTEWVGGHINLSMLIILRGEYHITASSSKSTKVAV